LIFWWRQGSGSTGSPTEQMADGYQGRRKVVREKGIITV